ncbi:hypothetical protein AMK32_31330 [Streptomyces sp. CB01883]|nr:hypothetical protein AMK32_31330 [Streptomyces sp. CB01883]
MPGDAASAPLQHRLAGTCGARKPARSPLRTALWGEIPAGELTRQQFRHAVRHSGSLPGMLRGVQGGSATRIDMCDGRPHTTRICDLRYDSPLPSE